MAKRGGINKKKITDYLFYLDKKKLLKLNLSIKKIIKYFISTTVWKIIERKIIINLQK